MINNYIYIVGAFEHLECVKIGRASSPVHQNRLQGLQTGNPFSLQVWGTFPVPHIHVKKIERNIHQKIDAPRLMGEWFRIHPREALARVEFLIDEFLQRKPDDGEKCAPYSNSDAVKRLSPEIKARLGICEAVQ